MKTRFRDVCNTHTPYKLSELHESSFPIRPYCNAIMSVFVREWVLFSFVPAWALLHRCSPIDTHIHRGAQQRPAGNGIVRYNTLTTKSIQSHKSTAYAYTR